MRYCQIHYQAAPTEQIEDLLSSFTKDNFVEGQVTHKLDDRGFNIDAGKNDIQAYYDEGEETIKFICCYEQEMSFYDKKLIIFATKHGIVTKLSSVKFWA